MKGPRHSASKLQQPDETLEHTIKARTAELSGLLQHLLVVREAEKARIARELHDELGSSLTAANMDLSWVGQHLKDQPRLAMRLTHAAEVLASMIETTRRIIRSLRPALLDTLGLSAAIESHAADFSRQFGIPIKIDVPDELPPLKEGCAIALFRIFEEALTNVSCHAKATQVQVVLHHGGGQLRLEVIDNGIGIDMASGGQRMSYGLLGMRERARQIGGQLSVERSPGGAGTMIRVTMHRMAYEIAANHKASMAGEGSRPA